MELTFNVFSRLPTIAEAKAYLRKAYDEGRLLAQWAEYESTQSLHNGNELCGCAYGVFMRKDTPETLTNTSSIRALVTSPAFDGVGNKADLSTFLEEAQVRHDMWYTDAQVCSWGGSGGYEVDTTQRSRRRFLALIDHPNAEIANA